MRRCVGRGTPKSANAMFIRPKSGRDDGAVTYFRTQFDAPISSRHMFAALTDTQRWTTWMSALHRVDADAKTDGVALTFRAALQANVKTNPRSFTVLDRRFTVHRTVSVDTDGAVTLAYSSRANASNDDAVDGEVTAHLTALGIPHYRQPRRRLHRAYVVRRGSEGPSAAVERTTVRSRADDERAQTRRSERRRRRERAHVGRARRRNRFPFIRRCSRTAERRRRRCEAAVSGAD